MPPRRQGLRRTHTGCITCKARSVKCDETRPSCTRCVSTGRTCDGYQVWIPKTLRQIQPSTTPDAGMKELQSLDFFRKVIGLDMAGPLQRSFWTRIIPQMVHTEPAVRHAAVAVSSLYRTVDSKGQETVIAAPEAKFALRHYSSAIKDIRQSNNLNYDVVGVACILFFVVELSVESLQGAWLHYQHGLTFLRSRHAPSSIRSIFRQLYVLSCFFFEHFGLPPLDDSVLPQPSGPFDILVDAQQALDPLAYRSYQVARDLADESAYNDFEIWEKALLKRHALHRDLEVWHATFQHFKSSRLEKDPAYMALEALEARYLICKIWTDPKHYRDAKCTQEDVKSNVATAADFIIGTKISPVMQAMLKTGQNLQVRLAALALLDAKLKHGSRPDKLVQRWEAHFTKCKEEIQQEHGITLGTAWAEILELENLGGMKKDLPYNLAVRTHFLCPWVIMVLNVVDRVGRNDVC